MTLLHATLVLVVGTASAITCQPGSFAVDGACQQCARGRFNEKAGGDCKPCVQGRYSAQRGQTVCTACNQGRYNDLQAGTECFDCAVRTFTDQVGQSACKNCTSDQNKCESCAKGRYRGGQAGGPNATADATLYEESGASGRLCACAPCPAGKYSDGVDQAECTPCPAGTFNDLAGQPSCKACASGSYSNLTAQDEAADCKTCPAGKAAVDASVASCTNCSRGLYGDAAVPCTSRNISWGHNFLQINAWRFADSDGRHFSVAHRDGGGFYAALFRDDGYEWGGDGRTRTGHQAWDREVDSAAPGIAFGDRFVQIGKWRICAIDEGHASICTTSGVVPRLFRADGQLFTRQASKWCCHDRPVDNAHARAPSIGGQHIDLGFSWRIGDIDGAFASISTNTRAPQVWTQGHGGAAIFQAPQVWTHKGTVLNGPRTDSRYVCYADTADGAACSGSATCRGMARPVSQGCKTCDLGLYSDRAGQEACRACARGQFNDRLGQAAASACTNCSAGLYTVLPAQGACTGCARGMYKDQAGGGACQRATWIAATDAYTQNGLSSSCNNPLYFTTLSTARSQAACLSAQSNGWLALDLGSVQPVVAIATGGRPAANQWVRDYTVDVSTDNTQWSEAPCASGRTCPGNTDDSTVVTNELASMQWARYVRVNVVSYKSYAALRMGSQWLTSYTVDVSMDNANWTQVLCASGRACPGNTDDSTTVTNRLARAQLARYVRVNVESYKSYASLRLGVVQASGVVQMRRPGAQHEANRTGQRRCEEGYYCERGVRHRCPRNRLCRFSTAAGAASARNSGTNPAQITVQERCKADEFAYNGTMCIKCPLEGADCSDGAIKLKVGFWYADKHGPLNEFWYRRQASGPENATTNIYRCPRAEQCLVEPDELEVGAPNPRAGLPRCAANHGGVLCSVCDPGYYSAGHVEGCKRCPSSGQTAASTIALLGTMILLVRLGKRAWQRVRARWPDADLTKLTYEMPQVIKACQGFFSAVFSFDIFGQPVFACAAAGNTFSKRFLWHTFTVLAITFALTAMLWLSERREHLSKWRATMWNVLLPFLFVVYPSVSMTTILMLRCDTIDGRRYLLADYSVRCDEASYRPYFGMAVVFLLVFPVGIPTLFTYVLARNRHKLPPDWWPHNLQEEEGKAFNAHRAQKGNEWAVREEWRQQVWRPTVARWHKYEQRFGFLFNAYHHRFYWFESVMSIYKLLMTTVVVFVSGANASRGDILRMLYSMFMAVCLIALVAFLQPFKDADVLSVETMVQLELLLVLFAALFLSELPWAAGHPFSGLILVVLLLVPVFAVALLMWRSVRDELKKRGRHDSLQGGESSRPRATTKATAKFSPAARSSERKKPGLERLDTSFNMVNPLASQRMDNDPGGGEKGSGSGRERPAGMFRGASRWAKKPRLPGKGKRG
eukprot:g3782.t1